MKNTLLLKKEIPFSFLENRLRDITFRGVYDKTGKITHPYKKAKFRLTTIYPPKNMGSSPEIKVNGSRELLFSPQPTIYQDQIEIMKTLDGFLKKNDTRLHNLTKALEYEWVGRGVFNVLPPIVEKHTYSLRDGFFDLNQLSKNFKNLHIKDARGNLHDLSQRYLYSFFVDDVSKIDHLDVFNSNAPLINYGLRYNGKHDFYIVCDGSHRIDYGLEVLGKPVTVILVEPEKNNLLVPYYAFPVPFRPTVRLSSKRSEKMYPRLERDKIHLFNDFIKKVLHYDWSAGNLNVSSLRSKTDIN